MKKPLIILIFMLVGFVLYAGDYLHVSGYLTDINSGKPVQMHEVYLESNDSIFFSVLITGQNGYYADSLYLGGIQPEILHIFTYDCENQMHDTLITTWANSVVVNFQICDPMNPGNCNAFFYLSPEVNNPYTINFHNFSIYPPGSQPQWLWEFDDGATSNDMNPQHTFQSDGMYNVCLTMIDSLHNCYDTFCRRIAIPYLIPGCEAKFITQPQMDPYQVQFIDLSVGNPTSWFWDFGDGASSAEQNPVHTYPETGQYQVCLTVSNPDSMAYCFDIYCDTLLISDTLQPCEALFASFPDSTSVVPYRVFFTDLSRGNPDSWFWDFGYGNSSTEKNPAFSFSGPGTYTVCLTITRTNPIGPCSDFICKDIVVPDYFDLGGFAFAGEYPINNPVFTGDTGIAYLYKVFDTNYVFPVDTSVFVDYGYYWFPQKMEGEYLVKIKLSETSAHYESYIPTYFGDHTLWTNTPLVHLTDSNYYSADIHLMPTAPNTYATGKILGSISWCPDYTSLKNNQLENILILLFNDENIPVLFTYTDRYGSFTFDHIPFDQYTVIADATGYYSTAEGIVINESHLTATVQLELCYPTVLDIREHDNPQLVLVQALYPNPAGNIIFIDLNLQTAGNLEILLYDVAGRELGHEFMDAAAGIITRQVNLSKLNEGIYFITVINQLTKAMETRKFIKIE